MLLQPKELGCFHFRRNRPTYVAQDLVFGAVDVFCLLHRPVIHPDDDVLGVLAARAHGDRAIVAVVEIDDPMAAGPLADVLGECGIDATVSGVRVRAALCGFGPVAAGVLAAITLAVGAVALAMRVAAEQPVTA